MELPYLKFYPRDWRGDEQLGMCSLGARGLWIEMLAIMASSARRGFLEVGGVAIKDAQVLARQVRADSAHVAECLAELERVGVFSRDEDGTIYSRRMVRDATVSDMKRQAGLRGGNPSLVKQPVKPVDIPISHKPESRVQSLKTISPEPLKAQGSRLSISKKLIDGWLPDNETDFIALLEAEIGKGGDMGMNAWGANWRLHWREDADLCVRVIAEYRRKLKASEPMESPGQFMGDLWKRWKESK